MTLSVWRIASNKALTLSTLALGSTYAPGRWHLVPPDGLPVVYAGASRALCQLEKRVHCNGVRPMNQVLMRLDLDDAAAAALQEAPPLPPGWVGDEALTQTLGVRWRRSGAGLGLWVPSAVEAGDRNLVLNPDHPLYAGIRLTVERDPFVFDARMF